MRDSATLARLLDGFSEFLDTNLARDIYQAKAHELLGGPLGLKARTWTKEAATSNFCIHLLSSLFTPLAEVVLAHVLRNRDDKFKDMAVYPINVEPEIPELSSRQSGDLNILLRSGRHTWTAFSVELKADSVMHTIGYPTRLRTVITLKRFRLEDRGPVKLDVTRTSVAAAGVIVKGCLQTDAASEQHEVPVKYFFLTGARLSTVGELVDNPQPQAQDFGLLYSPIGDAMRGVDTNDEQHYVEDGTPAVSFHPPFAFVDTFMALIFSGMYTTKAPPRTTIDDLFGELPGEDMVVDRSSPDPVPLLNPRERRQAEKRYFESSDENGGPIGGDDDYVLPLRNPGESSGGSPSASTEELRSNASEISLQ